MRRSTVYPAIARLAALLFSLFFLFGCVSTGEAERRNTGFTKTKFIDNGDPVLSVFINLKEPQGPGIWMRVTAIDILAGQTWISLTDSSFELDAMEIKGDQLFLGRRQLKAAVYDRLRITLDKASIRRSGKDRLLSITNSVVEIPFGRDLTLAKDESRTLLITWDVAASRLGKAMFSPRFNVESRNPVLSADLAYISCPEINTIYMVRTDRNWVAGSIGISGRPTYLAVCPSKDRLYVLAADESLIKVVELSSHQLVEHFQIPMIIEPGYMTVSPDGQWAFVVDRRSNNLYKIDLESGSLVRRVRFNEQPDYLYYMEDHARLAVTSSSSRNIFLVDIDTLETVETISTGSSSQGLLVQDDTLYIAEGDTNSVSVYDLGTKQLLDRILVGFSPYRIVGSGGYIYVSNRAGRSLSVLLPGQVNESSRISVEGSPAEMGIVEKRRWLYAADEDTGGLIVVDLTAHQVSDFVDLASRPVGIAVLQ
jgi:DNA-binding beta-propeller fold protein YncE